VAELTEDEWQSRVWGCLTGDLLLEIKKLGSKRVAVEAGEFVVLYDEVSN
jgi:hypothetical protein